MKPGHMTVELVCGRGFMDCPAGICQGYRWRERPQESTVTVWASIHIPYCGPRLVTGRPDGLPAHLYFFSLELNAQTGRQ